MTVIADTARRKLLRSMSRKMQELLREAIATGWQLALAGSSCGTQAVVAWR
jgi:hypothetical protein